MTVTIGIDTGTRLANLGRSLAIKFSRLFKGKSWRGPGPEMPSRKGRGWSSAWKNPSMVESCHWRHLRPPSCELNERSKGLLVSTGRRSCKQSYVPLLSSLRWMGKLSAVHMHPIPRPGSRWPEPWVLCCVRWPGKWTEAFRLLPMVRWDNSRMEQEFPPGLRHWLLLR